MAAGNNNQGITITITAATADAAARMKAFFDGASRGIERITGAGELLKQVGGRIAAVFSAGAVVEFTREAINSAAALKRLNEETGLSLKLLSALKEKAEEGGTGFEQMAVSLGLFANQLGTAVRQGGQAAQAFRDLIGVQGLAGFASGARDVDSILLEVIGKFNGLENGPKRVQLAMDLFGRSGRELIPVLNELRAGLQEGSITPALALQAAEFNRTLRVLHNLLEEVFISLAVKFLPALQGVANWFKAAGEAGKDLNQSLTLLAVSFTIEFSRAMANGLIQGAKLFLEVYVAAGTVLKKFLADIFVEPINNAINLLNKSGRLAALLGGSIQPLSLTGTKEDLDKQAEASLHVFSVGFDEISKRVNGVFDRGLAAVRALTPGRAGEALGPPAPGGGAGGDAPLSEEAKRLVADIDRAHAEATRSRMAMLNLEELELKKKVEQEVLDVRLAEAEKLKVEELYSQKRNELARQEDDARAEIELAKVQGRRHLVEKEVKTEEEKRGAILALLREENRLLSANIALQEKRVGDMALTPEARLQASQQLQGLRQRQAENEADIQVKSAEGTFGGEFRRVLTDLGNEWGNWASQVANSFKEVFNGAISSISNGITGLIMGTKTWGEALREVGRSILTSVINAIVTMGVRWVLTQIMMAAAGKGIQAAAVAASAPVAAAQSAIWATPAALSTVASYGGSAVAAPGFIAAAIGLTEGLAAASSAAGAVGYAEGGYTGSGDRRQVAGVVHRGEYVFSAPAVERIGVRNLEGMHGGGRGERGEGRGGRGKGAQVNLAIFSDENEIPGWVRTQEGETHIVNVVRRNWHQIG